MLGCTYRNIAVDGDDLVRVSEPRITTQSTHPPSQPQDGGVHAISSQRLHGALLGFLAPGQRTRCLMRALGVFKSLLSKGRHS